MSTWAEPNPSAARPGDWADPGFFSSRLSRESGFWRLLWIMVLPPEGSRIIPTPAGYALILVALGLGTAAYNTASNILFMALSLLLSSLILSGFLSWLNFKGTRWRLNLPTQFRVGEKADLQIELRNTKALLPTYNICFNVRTRGPGKKERVFLDSRLNAGEQRRLGWIYRPQERGRDTIIVSGLESQFPFGFLRKIVGGGIKHPITVFPARIDYTFQPPVGHHARRRGEASRRPGGGAELINIRRYQQGDSQRLVHWKASARLRRLMIRQMAEENRDGYLVFVESPASLWSEEGKLHAQTAERFEKLCSFAGSLAEDLFRQGSLIAYAINDEPVSPVKRLHDLNAFLLKLSTLAPVEHYQPSPEITSYNLITFRPGVGASVHAYVGGNSVGTA
ncbi:DUF58 domain-containing protein [Ruficoccus amylovorans]|uniref:DUF58 domain-containing protein n=1 Tax=Ruficoccus amylovorans TaxID=1804625 RepID=A0A842HAP7_9BACT|nr:DUF58 domain-containing protein [Ruficoccus amylovorans]